MAIFLNKNSLFDDVIFEKRNKEYGAYVLRKNYNLNVIISLLFGIAILSAIVTLAYFDNLGLNSRNNHTERLADIKFENFDKPEETIVVPPPLAVQKGIIQQAKYVAPVVIDSVMREEEQILTSDEAMVHTGTEEAVEPLKEIKEDVLIADINEEPFLVVEEMPEADGGLPALHKYIADNTKYPVVAQENNIQGKVFVKFCVTSKGDVEQVSIFKGVDPQLDAEAMRIVRSFPHFKPGKQGGRPVPVWLVINVDFMLN